MFPRNRDDRCQMQKLENQPRSCELSQNVNKLLNLYRDVTLCFSTLPSVNSVKDNKLKTTEEPTSPDPHWSLAVILFPNRWLSQGTPPPVTVGSLVWRCEMMPFKQSCKWRKNYLLQDKRPHRLETNLCGAESVLWRTIKHNSQNQRRVSLQTGPRMGREVCVFSLLFCASDNPDADLTEAASSEIKAHPYSIYTILLDSFVFDKLAVKRVTFRFAGLLMDFGWSFKPGYLK